MHMKGFNMYEVPLEELDTVVVQKRVLNFHIPAGFFCHATPNENDDTLINNRLNRNYFTSIHVRSISLLIMIIKTLG